MLISAGAGKDLDTYSILKGGAESLPGVNWLVDLYNATSLSHLLPVGGEDLDRLVGCCELRIANADDRLGAGENPSKAPHPGEVIWSDEVGWTCRRWNWRQGMRTRLTDSTENAFFLVEGMASPGYEPGMAEAAGELSDMLGRYFSPEQLETLHLVSSSSAQIPTSHGRFAR